MRGKQHSCWFWWQSPIPVGSLLKGCLRGSQIPPWPLGFGGLPVLYLPSFSCCCVKERERILCIDVLTLYLYREENFRNQITKKAVNPTCFVTCLSSNEKQSEEEAPFSRDGHSRPRVLARGWCRGYPLPSTACPACSWGPKVWLTDGAKHKWAN